MRAIDTFFIIVGAILAVSVLIGLLRAVSERYFSYYGGLGGTIVVYAVNTLEFCFLAWLLHCLMTYLGIPSSVSVDWDLGLILGPVYATYCWITKSPNRGIKFFWS